MPAAALACAWATVAEVAHAQDDFALSEPRPGVFVHRGRDLPLDVPGHDDIANIGFVVGSRCVAVIDAGGSVRVGRRLREAIRRRTPLPVCFVIDTHVHVDHVLGNAAFLSDHPHFVGHARLAQAMVRSRGFFMRNYAGDFDGPPSAAQVIGPDRLVVDTLVLDLGRRELRLRAWPSAHSDCDVSVFDPRSGVLWTGDLLFRGRLPALDGNLKGWLGALDGLARTRATLVVPGHGELTADLGGALAREREYLQALYQGVRDELAEGQSVEDATRKVALAERPKWSLWDEVHPRNVARAYQELEWE